MKKIILTGSSSGFGLLAVKTLAAKGHTVYATMRNVNSSNAAAAQEIRQWAAANKANVEVVELDVVSDASVQKAVTDIAQRAGQIDVLINNAGISHIGVSETLTVEQTKQMFEVNFFGADRLIKAVLPYMRQQKDGLIINVTSVLARNHFPALSTYNASKAALDALSTGYHYELRSSGVDVIVVQPGGYPTTDIITKGLKGANAAVEAHYGDDILKVKAALEHYFTPTPDSPNPQEVADAMLQLVDMPKGSRPMWTLVGAGPLGGYIDQINQTTKTVVETMLGAMLPQ